jgi:hypothetical protein
VRSPIHRGCIGPRRQSARLTYSARLSNVRRRPRLRAAVTTVARHSPRHPQPSSRLRSSNYSGQALTPGAPFLASRCVRFGAVFRRVSLTVLEGLCSPRKASHDSEGLAGESDASPLMGVQTGHMGEGSVGVRHSRRALRTPPHEGGGKPRRRPMWPLQDSFSPRSRRQPPQNGAPGPDPCDIDAYNTGR